MKNTCQQFCTATYQVKVQGRLDESWSSWFDNMNVTVQSESGATVTTLTGDLVDQAALHGLLARIRDLGLQLLSVQRIDDPNG